MTTLTYPRLAVVGIDDGDIVWDHPVIFERHLNSTYSYYEGKHPRTGKYIKFSHDDVEGLPHGSICPKEYNGTLFFSIKRAACEGFIAGAILSGGALFYPPEEIQEKTTNKNSSLFLF